MNNSNNPASFNIDEIITLPPPEHLIHFFSIRGTPMEKLIVDTRKNIANILNKKDKRLLVIVGPCSIHDTHAAIDFAKKLKVVREKYKDTLEIVMRVYFEKPRTTVGWKGLINDPYLDESYQINEGLRIARQLLIDIVKIGVPAAAEFLDVISPQYIGDVISWGAIGARTTESQIHRELTSGSASPIGFKNGTDGNIKIAIDAIQSASQPHNFLSIHKSGQVATVKTKGNKNCHIILRGGKQPNYDEESVNACAKELEKLNMNANLMIDCSHGNSSKNHENQKIVIKNIAQQIENGSTNIFGVMIESNLVAGAQKYTPGKHDPTTLVYGQSITDACISWEDTEIGLEQLSKAIRTRTINGV